MRRTDRRPAPASRIPARWAVIVLLALLALLACLPVAAAPRIGVMTMEPGEIFFERFGHNAVVVEDPVAGTRTAYNYGYFDMEEPGFVPRFVRAEMMYMLVELPLEQDLRYYAHVGRGVTLQWLDVPADAAAALAARLHADANGPAARYRYDYYTANCSTKVRDAIDEALGGALKSQLVARSLGDTYRSESVRLASPAWWMGTGFHLGLGPYADRPLSRWDGAFIPMRLRDSLREAKTADGRPLVVEETVLLPHRLPEPPAEAPRPRGAALVVGLVLALAVAWGAKRAPRAVAAFALAFWALGGALGATMLFIWFGTAHVAGWRNLNLLLLNPLAWALLPGAWALLRGRAPSAWFRHGLWIVAGLAAVAGFAQFLPFVRQQNVEWVLLLLPVHYALLRAFSPRRA